LFSDLGAAEDKNDELEDQLEELRGELESLKKKEEV